MKYFRFESKIGSGFITHDIVEGEDYDQARAKLVAKGRDISWGEEVEKVEPPRFLSLGLRGGRVNTISTNDYNPD